MTFLAYTAAAHRASTASSQTLGGHGGAAGRGECAASGQARLTGQLGVAAAQLRGDCFLRNDLAGDPRWGSGP